VSHSAAEIQRYKILTKGIATKNPWKIKKKTNNYNEKSCPQKVTT
jgi:hypothetical protein